MAATASPAAPMPVKGGVAPLRAGQGYSFWLRRLHSLSGIVPIGAFLVEHFISNAFATRGPAAYTKQVELLSSFPFVVGLELFGIWLPILYHALYGFYIWYRGDSNLSEYPWTGNWMYAAQRWTGTIAFFYMVWHTWHLRFTGVHLLVIRLRLLAKCKPNFRTRGQSRFMRWEFFALPGISLTDCGYLRRSGASRRVTPPARSLDMSALQLGCCSFWWEPSLCIRS